jgi:hypothetical protein
MAGYECANSIPIVPQLGLCERAAVVLPVTALSV